MSAAVEKIESLRKALHEHNHRYYMLDQPIITDYEFDQMLKDLQELEKDYPEFNDPNSPTPPLPATEINALRRSLKLRLTSFSISVLWTKRCILPSSSAQTAYLTLLPIKTRRL